MGHLFYLTERTMNTLRNLRTSICGWLDDSIERDGFQEDAKVTSATTDDK